MKLSDKEESVKVYLKFFKNIIHSAPGGAYIQNIRIPDTNNKRNGFFIKRKELEKIYQRLKQSERIEKLHKLNEKW